MKILVTGGAGYVGSFIVRELAKKEFEVVIVDNLSCGHKEAVEGFRLVGLDLVTDKGKLDQLFKEEKFDGTIHMAGFIQMGESFKKPLKYFHNNLIGTINLLEIMVKNNVSNFIFSSSAGVYGKPEKLPIEESFFRNPVNPYGETKYMVERMLPWLDQSLGFKFISIRYFNAAGAALDGSIGEDHDPESHLIPLAIKAVMQGKEFTIFGDDYKTKDGTNVRDYIHVLDLARAHVLALGGLAKGKPSNFYNAGTGKGYSNLEVVEMIRKVTGLNLKIKIGPRRPGDTDSLYASCDKIKKDLNWQPKYSDLKTIVETAWKWHRTHPNGFRN